LLAIAIYKPPDVRPIIKAYEGKDIPVEYGKIEAEMKVKHIEEWKAKQKSTVAPATFGSLFSLSSSVSSSQSVLLSDTYLRQPSQPKSGPPLTYLEQKRAEAQKQFLEEQKYLRDHKDELEKLYEQDQQAMAAQIPGNLWEALDQYRGTAPPPPGAPNPTGTSAAPVGSVAASASASGSGIASTS